MKRLAICTGGGDCPGLNAVIRSVVKCARGNYGWQVFGIIESVNGLLSTPPKWRELAMRDVTDILTQGGTILATSNRGSPFADDEQGQANLALFKENFLRLGLDALIVVGGEGTQHIASILLKAGIPVIGVPKTIDRDLPGTDETVGFHTAVEIASDAAVRLQTTAESHDRIMILEVMGRHTGHIALHAGLAGAANIVLIPEIPFDYAEIIRKIEERKAIGRYFSLIVVAEGAHEKGQDERYRLSSDGRKVLGGISAEVSQKLFDATGIETRVTVLGHTQRGGTPSPYDRNIGTLFGWRAVELIKQEQFGRLVCWSQGRVNDIGFDAVERGTFVPIPLDSDYIKSAESIGTCLGRKLSFNALA